MNLPRRSKTYDEQNEDAELTERISNIAQNIDRLYLVFDIYRTKSTKSHTRASQGKIRVSVRKKTSSYKEFNPFIKGNENKTEPFEMIASVSTSSNSLNQTIIATNQENILCNKQEMLDELQPCNHEEAGSRLLLHVYNVSRKRFKKLSILRSTKSCCNRIVLFLFPSFQWIVGRIWRWSTSKIYSNCSLFGGRILLGNAILFCFNWLWHSFAVSRERKTNCVASLGMLLWSNRDICEVFGCLVLFIRTQYINKFHKISSIRNLLKMERLQNYAKQWHRSLH